MKPSVSKRRFPKPSKEESKLVSTLKEGVRYFLDVENTLMPVTMLIYGDPDYKQCLTYAALEESIESMMEEGDSIPLDAYYLQLAINDKRLYLDREIKKPIDAKKIVQDQRSPEPKATIYEEIDKAYRANSKAVYYKYLDALKRLGVKPEKAHLTYIQKKCSYAEGWIFYKCGELGIK
jgi:hypothetical protein